VRHLKIHFSRKFGRICSPFEAITENGAVELFFPAEALYLNKLMKRMTGDREGHV